MSILNVDKIQPIGGGSTITVDATDIQATSATITASKFVGSGDLSVTGVSTFTGNIDANGDLDVDGHTNLDNVNIAGVTTMSGALFAEGNSIEIKGTSPYLALTDTDSNPDYSLFNSNGVFSIYDGTNSTNRLTISSSGQIGMGIDSPTQESGTGLHIRGAFGGQTRIHLTNSGTGDTATDGFYIISQGAESGAASGEVMLQQKENKALKFATNGSERLRIESTGGLKFTGQGTSIPVGGILHHTNNNLYVRGGTSGLVLGNHDNTNTIHISNSDFIKFETTDGTERLRITSDGKIGINQDTPRALLSLGGTVDAQKMLIYDNDGATNEKYGFGIQSNELRQFAGGSAILSFGHISSSDGSTYNEKLRITASGKVKMTSTTNNQRGLSVIAPKTQINFGTSEDVGGFLMSENNGQFGLSGGAYWTGSNWVARYTGSAQIRHDGGGAMVFCTNASLTSGNNFVPTERFRIGQNSNSSSIGSFGTTSTHLNNCTTPDRASFKVGGRLHVEGAFGHNAMTGLYYNCYSGGNDLFYSGTYTPSGGDGRAAAITMRYGGVAVMVDNSSTAYSPTNQITTMQNALNIDREGRVTTPVTPSFFAHAMSGSSYDNGTMTGGNVSSIGHNIGSHYNTGTGIFTAPVAGRYITGCGVLVENSSGRLEGNISKNNSTTVVNFNGTGTTYDGPVAVAVVQLAANDTLRVKRQSGNAYDPTHGQHYFFAHLIG